MPKTDLRVQRTYKLLTDALMEMLTEQSFNEITVRALCQRAMVRPATFYKHFGDKYELFTFMVRQLQQRFSSQSPFRDDVENHQNYYASLVDQTLSFLEQNKEMVAGIVRSSASPLLIDLLSEQIEKQVCIEFKEDQKRDIALPGRPEIMAPLFTGALVYLAKWWVLNDWKTPREELVQECLLVLGAGASS